MNDVEHDLRELFDRKASSVGGVAPRLPDAVRKRSRRREVGTALVSGLTALALIVGSVAVVRSLDVGGDDRTVVDDPWSRYQVFERAAQIGSFTITSSSDWYLIRPAGRLCPGEGCEVLQLSNFDPGLAATACGAPLPPDGVALVLTAQTDLRLQDLPTWPTTVEDPNTTGRCGTGRYFHFKDRGNSVPYTAWMGQGPDASSADVSSLIKAFQEMTLEANALQGTGPAAYVVAGGENAVGAWRLELRPSDGVDPNSNIRLALPQLNGGEVSLSDVDVTGTDTIEQAGGDPVFGAVSKEATRVELRLEADTPPIPAHVVPLPPSMPFDFDIFFASNDSDVQATAVAMGPDGELATPPGSIDAVPTPTFLDELEHQPSDRSWSPATTRQGDLVVMPITFPDGATAELIYPPSLGLEQLNVYPDAYADLEGERSDCGWPVHATRADPRAGWLKGEEPLDRYVTDDGRTFELWRGHRPYTMLVSRTGSWNVLVSCTSTNEISGGTAQWAELLTPREARDGLLILTTVPPLRLQLGDEGATVRLSNRDVIIDVSSGRAQCDDGSADMGTVDDVVQWCIEPAGVYLYATAIGRAGTSILDGLVSGLEIRSYRPAKSIPD